MKRLLVLTALLSTAVFSASAQSFGTLFPVTNTRYGPAVGVPRLTTNSQDFFLFWATDMKVRATRLRGEEPRGGHVIFDISAGFDTAWLGDRFLAVTSRPVSREPEPLLIGRLLDENAQPTGPEVSLGERGFYPVLAVGSQSVLMTYIGTAGSIRALTLGLDGKRLGASHTLLAARGTGHAVASNGKGFVAVVSDDAGIRSFALDSQGRIVKESSFARPRDSYRIPALAGNGSQYMAVWCDAQAVVAVTIDENGAFGAPLTIDGTTRWPGAAEVVWNGAGWTVAYDSPDSTRTRAHVVQVHSTGQQVLAREESPEGHGTPALAALDGRTLAAWRSVTYENGSASVVELPVAQNTARVATYSAAWQSLLATASSADATLIVWTERIDGRGSLRAGLRTHTGSWSEQEISSFSNTYVRAVAASDGRQFAVAFSAEGGTQLLRLDDLGRKIGAATTLPLFPSLMAWNGARYAIVSGSSAVLVEPSGEVSPRITIPNLTFDPTALVSDGNGFLLVGNVTGCPPILCSPSPVAASGVRLGPNLERVDAVDLIFVDEETGGEMLGAVWNGSRYIVISATDNIGFRMARVPSSPDGSIETSKFHVWMTVKAMVARSDGSIAIAGPAFSEASPYLANRVFFLDTNGALQQSFEIQAHGGITATTRLAPLPAGGVAYLASSIQDPAPHHGVSHVMMAIAQTSPPPLPGAPYVGARIDGNSISVTWSAPSGTLNGYRLEYRVDDGSWNELEQWFSPGATHINIRRPSFGTNFAIRMRAFNDGGAGPYSAVALTNPSRRRAVR